MCTSSSLSFSRILSREPPHNFILPKLESLTLTTFLPLTVHAYLYLFSRILSPKVSRLRSCRAVEKYRKDRQIQISITAMWHLIATR